VVGGTKKWNDVIGKSKSEGKGMGERGKNGTLLPLTIRDDFDWKESNTVRTGGGEGNDVLGRERPSERMGGGGFLGGRCHSGLRLSAPNYSVPRMWGQEGGNVPNSRERPKSLREEERGRCL